MSSNSVISSNVPSSTPTELSITGSNELVLSIKCYVKMIMHALRYPHATVNGVLIMEKKSKSSKLNRLVDCIPLFHSGHGLTPMVEVALAQIEEYLCKNTNCLIGGYYQVNEYFHELPNPVPTLFAERIAEKIYESNSDSVMLMISNYDLATAIDEANSLDEPLYLFYYAEGKWKLKNKGFQLENPDVTFEALQELIFKDQQHLNLVDFDSHLENVNFDWRNLAINNLIDGYNKS